MTNVIITNLEQNNKELLEENENLKKQLADKEENFKLRIWNAVHSLTESSEYTGTALRILERFTWPNNGWVSYPEKNGLEVGRVIFNEEFTPENIVKSFSEQAQNYEESFSFTYQEKKELEARIEELEDEVEMEREEAEKALDAAMKWRKHQMSEVVLKHSAAMGKLIDRIKWLENSLLNKDQEISRRDYLATKELPALPKKQKENRLWKLKHLVNKVKEKSKEKFQTFIIQRNK